MVWQMVPALAPAELVSVLWELVFVLLAQESALLGRESVPEERELDHAMGERLVVIGV